MGGSGSESTFKSILSTDLSFDKDPDDWFDTVVFSTHQELNPVAVIIDQYGTDELERKTREVLGLLGAYDVHVLKGVIQPLELQNGALVASRFHDGAHFILECLQSSTKVDLFCVGSLRNEALAYSLAPKLFVERVRTLYFAGGTVDGRRETNINRDMIAAEIILNSPVPIVWVPCSPQFKQKLTAEAEAFLARTGHPLASWLTESLRRWRQARGETWLAATEQLPHQGKNLWSIPAFLWALGYGEGYFTAKRGKIRFDREHLVSFDFDPSGKDVMITSVSSSAIVDWVMRHLKVLML